MASVLLTVAGSALGNALLPGIGGPLLGSVGALAGASLDQALFGSTSVKGPRLENLKVQDSSYGAGLPLIYGHARVAGHVIWASDIVETITEEEAGGKGGGSATTISRASYSLDCAVAVGLGPIGRIATIWADSKIIYSNGAWKAGVVADAEIYVGSTTQNPSPVMEGAMGSGNVPAYRGLAYVVLHGLQLGLFGNRMPNLSFETEAVEAALAPRLLGVLNPSPSFSTKPDAALHPMAAPPIIAAQRGGVVTELYLTGLIKSGTTFSFSLLHLDITGQTPIELNRTTSASFNVGADCNDFTSALSPDGRCIAFFAQMLNAGNSVRVAVFDCDTQSFGNIASEDYAALGQQRQLAWLGPQHLVAVDTVSGKRGVRVYVLQGTTPVALGFYDVWGTSSSSTRFQMKCTQFAALSGGVLCIMADHASTPSNVYARHLQWQQGGLAVGAEMLFSGGLAAFAATSSTLLPLADGHFLFARWNTTTLKCTTLLAGYDAVTTTRSWASFSFGGNGNASLAVRNDTICFIQFPVFGAGYVWGEITLTETGFSSLLSGVVGGTYSGTVDYFTPFYTSSSKLFLAAANSSGNYVRLAMVQRADAAVTLETIVADLLARAGYETGDSALSSLSSTEVEGYVVDGPMPARAACEPLQAYESFHLVESDGVLKASLFAAAPSVSIALGETRAASLGHDQPPLLTITRAQEQDGPREVVVDYPDAALDFQRGSQRARRLSGASRAILKMAVPVMMDAARAKRVAERHLYLAHAEQKEIQAHLSRAYAPLDPGDVIQIAEDVLRITETALDSMQVKIKAVPALPETLNSAANADSGGASRRIIAALVPTNIYLLDIPLLRREDNQPGFYVAATGYDGWQGATLWRAADNITYTPIDTLRVSATSGVATTVLGSASTAVMDREQSVTVSLIYGSLASITDDELLAGGNAALLGHEIIQFKTATLNADGSYTLSQLLRGRRGTESDVATHSISEHFVLLSASTLHFLPLESSVRGISARYRGVTVGQALDDAPYHTFTPSFKTLQPFAPVHLAASRNTGGDITFTWKRRARRDAEWVDYVDVPLDEDTESYDVEILNGVTVVRTFSNLSSATANYSAAQQTSDFGAAQSSVRVRVIQNSALYGRGANAEAVL